MIAEVPRDEAEQVYSKASNIAVRNRSDGKFVALIAAIEESLAQPNIHPSSYTYTALANLHAWSGEPGWEEKYWSAIDNMFALLKEESPTSSWYEHSVSGAIRTAKRISLDRQLVESASRNGVDMADVLQKVRNLR